jgi:hypothetical protein
MALDTQDKLIAMLAAGVRRPIVKASVANQSAGQFVSLWRSAGMPTAGAIPGSFATCDNNLAGAFELPTIGALKGYIAKFGPVGVVANTFVLYDRLAHMGGLSGTVATAQTANVDIVTASSNGRCAATGSDVEWFIEVYTDMGATGVNATVSYNDQSDGAQTAAAIALGATPRAGRMYQIIPNAGTSIKKVNTVTLSATTGTAGSFGVTACKCLAEVGQLAVNVQGPGDFFSIGGGEYKQTSCLAMLLNATASATGVVNGMLVLGTA